MAWDREAVTNLPTKTYACSNDEHAKTLTACICMVYQTWAPPLPSVWDTSGVICRGQESICSGSGATSDKSTSHCCSRLKRKLLTFQIKIGRQFHACTLKYNSGQKFFS